MYYFVDTCKYTLHDCIKFNHTSLLLLLSLATLSSLCNKYCTYLDQLGLGQMCMKFYLGSYTVHLSLSITVSFFSNFRTRCTHPSHLVLDALAIATYTLSYVIQFACVCLMRILCTWWCDHVISISLISDGLIKIRSGFTVECSVGGGWFWSEFHHIASYVYTYMHNHGTHCDTHTLR